MTQIPPEVIGPSLPVQVKEYYICLLKSFISKGHWVKMTTN